MATSYQVKLHPAAKSDLALLDGSLQKQLAGQLLKLTVHPYAGEPLGRRAGFDLSGYRSLHFAGQRYRIVYRLDAEAQTVWVIAIGKKAKFEVHDKATQRAENL